SGPASTGAVDNAAHPRSRWATLPPRGARQRRVPVPRARGRGAGGPGVRDRWRRRLDEARRPLGEPGRPLDEAEGLALPGDWGGPVVAAEVATGLEGAREGGGRGGGEAGGRVGWPGALKAATAGVGHKSEVGGVRLGLDGPERLAAAYADLAARLGPRGL